MRKAYKLLIPVIALTGFLICPLGESFAGNEDRVGQAGATELLINPWARSSGWAGANTASIRGLEAIHSNVAGTAFTRQTEVIFTRTSWLKGSDININAFGITQKVGESGVIGLGLMSMDFGDIEITRTDLPEGGIGTYSPQFLNLAVSYAKIFSNSIYGGFSAKIISESLSNIKTQGIAFDAGIQYVTGLNADKDNLKFGISLRNVGPPLKFDGDGLSFRGNNNLSPYDFTVQQRSASFEIPSLVNIGVAYDFKLAEDHRLTTAGNFTSNSFSKDNFMFGVEYGFKEFFMIRGGFMYQDGIFDDADRLTAYTGPTAGFTLQAPLGKGGKTFALDYSFRATDPFEGTHSFGARLDL